MQRRLGLVVLLVAALVCCTRAVYAGATLNVTTVADTFDGNCAPSDCSLRDAIWVANALGSGAAAPTIVLPAGVYRLARIGAGLPEDQGTSGDLDITAAMTIQGAGVGMTVIDANGIDRAIHILAARAAPVALSGMTIRGGNTPQGGGGVLNDGAALTLDRVAIQSNVVALDGGGLLNLHGSATLSNTQVAGNLAIGRGGNIANQSTLSADHSEISHGDAARGAGVWNAGALQLRTSTLSGNIATAEGGAIASEAGAGDVTLVGLTIAGNSAASGGALFAGGALTISASIIAVAPSSDSCAGPGPIVSGGANLETTAACGLSQAGDLGNVDPRLGPLADNGGPTRTHALLPGSPAIDHGSNQVCASTDQRGRPRPSDGDLDAAATCDIGAYELVWPSLALPLIVAP
jgi:CSLREA domain-containing protein